MLTAEVLESLAALQNMCRNGDLPGLRSFFSTEFPSISQERRLQYCAHGSNPESCKINFCPRKAEHLAEDAAGASQVPVFEYIWDTFLLSYQQPLSWAMLKAAALQGSVALAESFWERDKGCFKVLEPAHPHGSPGGTSQITIALRNDRYEYTEYILAHGADINSRMHEHSILRSIIRCVAEPGEHLPLCRLVGRPLILTISISDVTLRRTQFLISHGAIANGSQGLLTAVETGHVEVVRLLLSNGADPDDSGIQTSTGQRDPVPLSVASVAGDRAIVDLLLAHGAETSTLENSHLSLSLPFGNTR